MNYTVSNSASTFQRNNRMQLHFLQVTLILALPHLLQLVFANLADSSEPLSVQKRIVKGTDTPGFFAQYTCIHCTTTKFPSPNTTCCSGVLARVGDVRFLLTTAHCFVRNSSRTLMYFDRNAAIAYNVYDDPNAEVQIKCGEAPQHRSLRLTSKYLKGAIRLHKRFEPILAEAEPNEIYDIAILKFRDNEILGWIDERSRAKRPWAFWDAATESFLNPSPGTLCVAVGYGGVSYGGPMSPKPLLGTLKVQKPSDDCWFGFDPSALGRLIAGMPYLPICLKPVGSPSCPLQGLTSRGDSGGPLFCNYRSKNGTMSYRLAGLTSSCRANGSTGFSLAAPLWHKTQMNEFLNRAIND